ncbi:hypothetical protein D3C79_793380 [compost metagenome]
MQVVAQGEPGGLLIERLGFEQLIEAGVARRRRPQGNGRDPVQALAELIGWGVVALDDGRQLLAKELQVQLAGAVADAFGVDLLGHRLDHPVLVLLLQVQGQAFFRRLAALTAVELVPGDLEGQPLLGPVTGEPGNEVAFGTLLYLFFPYPHRAPRIVVGRACGAYRCIDQFLVDALPGGGGQHGGRRRRRRTLAGAAAEGQQKAEQHEDAWVHTTASRVSRLGG